MAEQHVPADGRALVTRLEQMCSDCDGTGVMPDPDWEAWEEHDRRLVADLRSCHEQPVLTQILETRRRAHWALRPTGGRETACGGCDGVGTVPNEDGAQLLTFVLRHLNRP